MATATTREVPRFPYGQNSRRSQSGAQTILRHKLNQPLNPAQEAANEHLSGMQAVFHVNQLIMLLETDLMPDDDEHLRDQLAHLAELIETWLPPLAETG